MGVSLRLLNGYYMYTSVSRERRQDFCLRLVSDYLRLVIDGCNVDKVIVCTNLFVICLTKLPPFAINQNKQGSFIMRHQWTVSIILLSLQITFQSSIFVVIGILEIDRLRSFLKSDYRQICRVLLWRAQKKLFCFVKWSYMWLVVLIFIKRNTTLYRPTCMYCVVQDRYLIIDYPICVYFLINVNCFAELLSCC